MKENEIKTYKKSWIKKIKDIYILSLEGNDYEMGEQYANLLEDEIKDGAVTLFNNYADYTLQHSSFGKYKLIRKIAVSVLEFLFRRRLANNVDKKYLGFMRGYGDAMSKPKRWARNNIVLTDFFMFLPAIVYGKNPDYQRFPQIMGCSSFGASPVATTNGHTISGHNKDFAAMEYWDKYQVVTFQKPDEGHRFMHLSGAGIPSSSIVSMNEHGLVLSGHVIPTNDIGYNGLPIFAIGDEVMKKCKTTEEAVRLLSEVNMMTGWKMHIIDKSGKTAIVEITANHNQQYYNDGMSSCANIYKGDEIMKTQIFMNKSYENNCFARQNRMEELMKQNKGSIDIQKAVSILGDREDIYTKSERSAGNIIAQMTNLNSIIFDQTDMKFWVSSGKAPTCNTVYKGFHFDCGFTQDFSNLPEDIESKYHKSDIYKGVREYIYANNEHFINSNKSKSVEHLEKAEKYDPKEIIYPLLSGIVKLQTGDYEGSAEKLSHALTLNSEDHKKHIVKLWLGRAYDLNGNRDGAVKIYKELESMGDKLDIKVLKAVRKNIKKKYNKKKLATLSLDFWTADTYEY